jgi:hypothetical protein
MIFFITSSSFLTHFYSFSFVTLFLSVSFDEEWTWHCRFPFSMFVNKLCHTQSSLSGDAEECGQRACLILSEGVDTGCSLHIGFY